MTKMMRWSPAMKKRKTNSLLGTRGRGLALAFTLALPMAGLCAGPQLAGTHQMGPVRRSVEGKVEDHNSTPVKGAIVYLKDTRTLAVRSFISDDSGMFHFGQLSENTDYELYAEYGGKRSKRRNISLFKTSNDFNFVLKIGA
jgi:hypothetical protein